MIRNIFLLSGGSAAAQALSFAFVPILSRLYAPADYGYLGVVAAASTIVASLVGLQFSQAMLLSRQVAEQSAILTAGGIAVLVQTLVLGCCLSLTRYALPDSVLSEKVALYGWPILVLSALAASNIGVQAWTTANGRYRGTAGLMLARTAATCGWQFILAGTPQGNGLVLGTVLGELTALVGGAFWFSVGPSRLPLLAPNFERISKVFVRFRHVLIYGTSREILHAVTMTLPVLAIDSMFGHTANGHFSMASRLLDAPANLIGSAVRTVTMQAFDAGGGSPRSKSRQLRKWLGLLALPALLALAAILLGADWGVRVLLGPGWEEAALYLKLLALWKMISFCKAPASAYLYATARDVNTFVYQLGGAAAMTIVLLACARMDLSAGYVVFCISVVGLGIDVSFIRASLKLAGRDELPG